MSSPDKSLEKYTIIQLKEMLKEADISMTGLKVKADFINKLMEKRNKIEQGLSAGPSHGPARGSDRKPPYGTSSSTPVDVFAIKKKFITAMNRGVSLTKLEKILTELPEKEKVKVVQLVDSTDGSTLLHWAARNNNIDVAELLLAYGANIETKAKDGGTPLHWAAYDEHTGEVAELLIQSGANLEALNKEGNTPLHVALTQTKESEVLMYNDSYKRGKNNLFQLHVAEILLKAGAKTSPMYKYQDHPHKYSLFNIFIKYPSVNITKYNEVVQLLINYDTEKDHLKKVVNHMTPLMIATDEENIEVIKMLLEKGVDINKEINKKTAYSYAIYKGNIDICNLLLEHGAKKTIIYTDELEFSYHMEKIMKERIKKLVAARLLQMPPEQFILITNPEELKKLCEKNKEEDGTYTCAISGELLKPIESIAIQTRNGNSQCYKKENLLRWINRDIAQTLNPLTNIPFKPEELRELRQKITQALGGKGKKKTNTKAKKRRS